MDRHPSHQKRKFWVKLENNKLVVSLSFCNKEYLSWDTVTHFLSWEQASNCICKLNFYWKMNVIYSNDELLWCLLATHNNWHRTLKSSNRIPTKYLTLVETSVVGKEDQIAWKIDIFVTCKICVFVGDLPIGFYLNESKRS